MEDTLWREPGDQGLFRAMESVWDFAERTCPRRFPPGVYKHRSIEEAQALAEVWDEANFRALLARRLKGRLDIEIDVDASRERPGR
jgi:hypothetical protein